MALLVLLWLLDLLLLQADCLGIAGCCVFDVMGLVICCLFVVCLIVGTVLLWCLVVDSVDCCGLLVVVVVFV